MNRAGRFMGAALLAAAMTVSTACTSGSSEDGDSASCAYRFLYEGHAYQDVANVEFTVGEKLGSATNPPCDDTGDQADAEESGTTKTVYRVVGISPEAAIAVGDTPGEAMFFASYSDSDSGTELPPEVKKLIANS